MLTLLRHAPTAAPDGQIVGQHDVPLSRAGQQAAHETAHRCTAAWTGPRPVRIVSSPLKRCRDTAAPLADAFGVEVVVAPRLQEVDFGTWDGRTWEAIETEEPSTLAQWMENWVDAAPPDGESFEMLCQRVQGWLDEQSAESNTLIVAHAGSIRALFCMALGLPLHVAFQFAVDPLRVHRLQHRTGTSMSWTLVLHNAAPAGM